MSNKIDELNEDLSKQLRESAAMDGINQVESAFKKQIKELFSQMKTLSADEKRVLGGKINEFKGNIEARIAEAKLRLQQKIASDDKVDLSIASDSFVRGKLHPLLRMGTKLEQVYTDMGYSIAYGPEIDNEKHNYEMLNMPYYHPARDMQDTFYLEYPSVLLRSHTSCVQVRYMLEHKPPFKIISPGVVYRVDEIDAQHTPCFYQVEGLVVGEGVSLANLKYAIIESIHRIFGEEYKAKFVPCYYPYTEPSAGIDMSCIMCGGKGCRTCKGTGWMRVGGAGMVHPNVFEGVGYSRETTGFAFGWGLNKFPMLYYAIGEMRKLFENEIALWEQL